MTSTTRTMVGWGTNSKIILLFVLLSFWFVFDFGRQIFKLTLSLFFLQIITEISRSLRRLTDAIVKHQTWINPPLKFTDSSRLRKIAALGNY